MRALLKPYFADPTVNARMLVASLFIHVLGLASAFYVTLVFGRYLTHGLDSTLITLTIGTILAMTLEYGLRRVRFRMMTALVAKREHELGAGMTARLLNASPTALAALDPQVRLAPTRTLEQLQAAVNPSNVLAILDAPFALVFLVVLTLMAWPLGIVAALFIVAAIIGIYFRGLAVREATQELQQANQANQAVLASADRTDTVRIANAGLMLSKRWGNRAGLARLIRHRVGRHQDRIQGFIQGISALLSVTTIAVGAKLVVAGQMDYGALFGANILAMRMFALVTRPAQSASQFLGALQSLESIGKFLDLPLPADDEGTRLGEFSGRIELRDVAFGFAGGTGPLFEGVSVRIEPGELAVVTGANGVGKTSFARLLAGLLEPTRGSIYADGVDLRQLKPHWWRRQLVYLPQEPEFLDGTLRENLMTLSPKLSAENLDRFLRRAGVKSFVDRHPKGLDMVVTQGGRTLSTGIRRRLALARALTTLGKVVVIDEPTEGLDHEGVETIHRLIEDFRQQHRTVIVMTQAPAEFVGQAIVINLDAKPVPQVVMPAVTTGKLS